VLQYDEARNLLSLNEAFECLRTYRSGFQGGQRVPAGSSFTRAPRGTRRPE
jgi:hypothetical protein